MSHDYTDYQPEPETQDLAKVTAAVQGLEALERTLADKEDEVKNLKARIKRVKEDELPEIMRSVGLRTFITTDGVEIELQKNVFASISASNKPAAFEWLRDNGEEKMVKFDMTIPVSPDKVLVAREQAVELRKKFGSVSMSGSVNTNTLKAWAKRRVEAGENIPDCITHHVVDVAKVKTKKS